MRNAWSVTQNPKYFIIESRSMISITQLNRAFFAFLHLASWKIIFHVTSGNPWYNHSWETSIKSFLSRIQDQVSERDLVLLFGHESGSNLFKDWINTMSAFKAKSVRPAPANYFRVRADDNNQTQSAVDEEIGLINDFNSKFQYNPPYIDKYVEQLYATINDPDCMEGEVDFASDDFRVENAIRIWQKCRLLVLRNIIDKAYIYEFRKNVTQFVYDLNEGKVNDKGRTSYADPYYVYDVSSHRWDLLLPSRFVSEQIITDGRLMQILSDERVLGEQMKLMAFGMVMSEPNAECQQWHNDADYVYGDGNSLRCLGAAGIEYPSSQITLMAPLLNITHQHGPTQFCMGSAALNGFDSLDEVDQWFDHALKERFFTNEMAINEFSDFLDGWCPQK